MPSTHSQLRVGSRFQRYYNRNLTTVATFKGKGYQRLLELLALVLVCALFVFIAWSVRHMATPITSLQQITISLDPRNLPTYAMCTTLRMLIAVFVSFLFTLIYATAAAKSRRLGQVLIPLLDILQSVPVLGYLSFTVTAFLLLFPHSLMGIELAAIFAIFTAQVWNMIFSLYQSLRTLPRDLEEAATAFKLSSWQKFWKVELPYATPELLWNSMMSMSGSWFFIVAAEAITLNGNTIMLPGMGSYIALATQQKDLIAVGYAILAMTVVIVLYNQMLFRPLVAWSDKFRYELSSPIQHSASSWVLRLFRRSKSITWFVVAPITWCAAKLLRLTWLNRLFSLKMPSVVRKEGGVFDGFWYSLLVILGIAALKYLVDFVMHIGIDTVWHIMGLAVITMLRVFAIVVLSALVWVPVGIYIGLNARRTSRAQSFIQFLAAFPANLVFPLVAVLIVRYRLNPNIWLSLLMMLGAQWYILFNVVAAASAIPGHLLEAACNLKVKGMLRWRKVLLPAIAPYFLTGAITAAGGAWNASIVAEVVSWGNDKIIAIGIGSYIAQMTTIGDLQHVALGVGVMSLFVVVLNRLFWRPLYNLVEDKFKGY